MTILTIHNPIDSSLSIEDEPLYLRPREISLPGLKNARNAFQPRNVSKKKKRKKSDVGRKRS